MALSKATQKISDWPDESRQAAELVIEQYGEPGEMTDSQLVWHKPGPWKRIVVTRTFYRHNFPAPHIDAVECVIDYRVPPEKFAALAAFDGSVIVERTAGEVSARCHDVQANFLALNLMHDIVTGAKSAGQARDYYSQEFLDYRRKKATPYMQGLRFASDDANASDPDARIVSDEDLQEAAQEGEQPAPSRSSASSRA